MILVAAIEFSAEFRTAPPGTCSLRRNGDGAIVQIVLNQFNFCNGSVRWGALALVR